MRHIHELPGEIGAKTADLAYCPLAKRKQKVHILALGDVGMTALIGLRLLGGDVIAEIGICDINEKNIRRLEMEINQIRYPFGPAMPPVRAVGRENIFDCDIFIFCASKGVPPLGSAGDVRLAQLQANKELAEEYGALAKDAAFGGLACIVSDPVEPLSKAFLQASGLRPSQVQGYGLGVMNARACYYAERDEQYREYLTEGRAFGPHGADLVIANSLDAYDDGKSRALTELVVKANLAVRDLGYKPYIAPALSSAALSILLTARGEWHYSSIYFGDEEKGAFFGVKNKMTPAGVVYEDAGVGEDLYERLKTAYVNTCRLG